MSKYLRVVIAGLCFVGLHSVYSVAQHLPQPIPQESTTPEKGECVIVGYVVDQDLPDNIKLNTQPLEITFTFDGKKIGKLSIPSSSRLKFPCTSGNHAVNFHIKRKYSGDVADCTTAGLFFPAEYTPLVSVPDRHGRFKCHLTPIALH